MTTWTDWRGNDYTEGTLILYARMSGRSCEMAEGVVVELYEVYYGDNYKWEKLAPGEPVPEHDVWLWEDPENPEKTSRYRKEEWNHVQRSVPRQHERRAKILPTNRTSRFGGYYHKKWVWDEESGKGEYVETEVKPVTLKITESITVPLP